MPAYHCDFAPEWIPELNPAEYLGGAVMLYSYEWNITGGLLGQC